MKLSASLEKTGMTARVLLLLIVCLFFCGVIVHAQGLQPADRGNGTISDNKVLIHRFSLWNSGVRDILSDFPTPEDSELQQFSGEVSLLIDGETTFMGEREASSKTESTIIWGGIFPFVALPSQDVENPEGLFSNDSISFFWYLKKRF